MKNTRTGYARPPRPRGPGGVSTVDGEEVARMCMIGDAAGAITQREAKDMLAMAPVMPLGPIGRDGCAAGGSQSGMRSSKGCVCVPCKGGRESACGGRLVSVATWPSVVRMSAECINVAKAGVISRGVTHTAAWPEPQTCSSRNAHGSKVGRVKRARSLMVRSARPERKRAHERRFRVVRIVDQICSS